MIINPNPSPCVPPQVEEAYTFARGTVKPANKKFSTVRNDYCLNFDAAAEVEPCGECTRRQMGGALDPKQQKHYHPKT